jgi:hypothetical protein
MGETARLKACLTLPVALNVMGCAIPWALSGNEWRHFERVGLFVFASYQILPLFTIPYVPVALGVIARAWKCGPAEHVRLLSRLPLIVFPAQFAFAAFSAVASDVRDRVTEILPALVIRNAAEVASFSTLIGYAPVLAVLTSRAVRSRSGALSAP